MVFSDFSILESENKKKSAAVTSTLFVLFLLCLIFIKSKFEPAELKEMGSGITVALGWPDQGMYQDTPSLGTPSATSETPPTPPTSPTLATSSSSDIASDEESEVTIRKHKEEKDRKDREELENKTRRDSENAAREKQRTQEEAIKRAEAEKAAFELAVKRTSGHFTGVNGRGTGNNGTPGNGGNPDGNPDTKNLDNGIPSVSHGTGSGPTVGGNLSGRTAKRPPAIIDDSQATGVVRINICADAQGNVTSATYTQSGSTTNDSGLKAKAIENAKRYRFSPGAVEECGWISYNFISH